MKLVSAIFISVFCCVSCFSQSIDSTTIIVNSGSVPGTIKKIIGVADGNYYLLVGKALSANYSIVKCNSGLDKQQTSLVFNKKEHKHSFLENVLLINNKLLLFTSQRLKVNDSTEKDITYAETINLQSLAKERRDTICTIEHKKGMHVCGRYILISPDSSKIGLILFQKTEKKNSLRCIVTIYNENMKLQWKASKEINCTPLNVNLFGSEDLYSIDNIESIKAKMDKWGNVFVLCPSPAVQNKVSYPDSTIKYYLYCYTNSGKRIKETSLSGYKDNTIDVADFYCRNDSLIISGICSKKTDPKYITFSKDYYYYVPQGTFLYKFNPFTDSLEKMPENNLSIYYSEGPLQLMDAGEDGNIVLLKGTHPSANVSFSGINLYGPDRIIIVKRSASGEVSCNADISEGFYAQNFHLGFYQDKKTYVIYSYNSKTYMAVVGSDCKIIVTEVISNDTKRINSFGAELKVGSNTFLYVQRDKKRRAYSFIKIQPVR